jgi:hypothetical protein
MILQYLPKVLNNNLNVLTSHSKVMSSIVMSSLQSWRINSCTVAVNNASGKKNPPI